MKKWRPVFWMALLSASMPVLALEEKDLQGFIDEAIKAGGGEVVIPPGEYVIQQGLNIANAKGLKLAGMDKERTVLRPGEELKSAMITVRGGSEKITIRKMTFKGNGLGEGTAIVVESDPAPVEPTISQVQVEDCLFQKGLATGVRFSGVREGVVERCTFAETSREAVMLDAADACMVRGNWLTRCAVGVRIEKSNKCQIMANEVMDSRLAIQAVNNATDADNTAGNNAFMRIDRGPVETKSGAGLKVSGNEIISKAVQ